MTGRPRPWHIPKRTARDPAGRLARLQSCQIDVDSERKFRPDPTGITLVQGGEQLSHSIPNDLHTNAQQDKGRQANNTRAVGRKVRTVTCPRPTTRARESPLRKKGRLD